MPKIVNAPPGAARQQVDAAWIKARFDETGKTKVGLAEALQIHASQIPRILKGERRLRADEIPVILHYFGQGGLASSAKDDNFKPQRDHSPIMVVGEVAAGVWIQVDETDLQYEQSPFPADPRFPVEAQYDLIVRGTSIDRFASPGERLRCVDITQAEIDVHDGDLVIVQRTRMDGAMIETTAKRYTRRGGKIVLMPDSTDPRWQEPLTLDARDGEEIRVVAKVVYKYLAA